MSKIMDLNFSYWFFHNIWRSPGIFGFSNIIKFWILVGFCCGNQAFGVPALCKPWFYSSSYSHTTGNYHLFSTDIVPADNWILENQTVQDPSGPTI